MRMDFVNARRISCLLVGRIFFCHSGAETRYCHPLLTSFDCGNNK